MPSATKNSGNIATAQIEIEGLPVSMTASSSVPAAQYGLIGKGSEQFTHLKLPNAKGDLLDRNIDSEYKILDNIADALGNNTDVKGSVTILTERSACNSCLLVKYQFEKKYSNIEVKIFNNNGVLLSPKRYVAPEFNLDEVNIINNVQP